MTEKILELREKLEKYAIYRALQNVQDWFVGYLEECQFALIMIGFILWPGFAFVCFSEGIVTYGIAFLLLYATYWLHIILFEEG